MWRVKTLTLRLENGEQAAFALAEECAVPDASRGDLQGLARGNPGRYAFWAYQAARQRWEVRKRKRVLLKAEADADIVCRRFVKEESDFDFTERAVRSFVDKQPTVKEARMHLDEAEYVLEVLESVRDAVRERGFILGRLLSTQAAADLGA